MSTIDAKLEALGLVLPGPIQLPPDVVLPFSWVRVHGDRAYVSGHIRLNPDDSIAEPQEPIRGMNTGSTAFSRSWARMALRRDAGSIASGDRRRPKVLKPRPFGSTQEARVPRRESANDAQHRRRLRS